MSELSKPVLVNDMSRFVIVELPAPLTHDERKQIAQRIASALDGASDEPPAVLKPIGDKILSIMPRHPCPTVRRAQGFDAQSPAGIMVLLEELADHLRSAEPPVASPHDLQRLCSAVLGNWKVGESAACDRIFCAHCAEPDGKHTDTCAVSVATRLSETKGESNG